MKNTFQYDLIPTLLRVLSNKRLEHGFLYGSHGNSYDIFQNIKKPILTVNIREVNNDVFEKDSEKYVKKSRYYFSNEEFGYSRKIPFKNKNAQFLFTKNNENFINFTFNKSYNAYSEFVLSRHFLPERVLSPFIYWQLLKLNFLSLHCSVISKNGKGLIIFALPDTGKSMTAFNLVKKYNFEFVAEDIAVTDGKLIYTTPYTRSGVWFVDNNRKKKKESFISKRSIKDRIIDYLPEEKIHTIPINVEIHGIIILKDGQKGITEIPKNIAKTRLYSLNSSEFHTISNSHVLNCSSLTGFPDIYNLTQKEISILDSVIDNSNFIIELQSHNSNEFVEDINTYAKKYI
ncbi:MAG: hypothetical protein ACOCP4_07615 [Candidatus Woesearchaeota archaeon]